ncbi:MAG: ABC transporter substrate-binding protein [Phycisphaerae bacterium]|nr:ABC transporter substrate-binding protein [Phycisphaerae bacterium]
MKMKALTMGVCLAVTTILSAQDTVKIGLNYPETGPYAVQGLDQLRAAQLAVEEINAAGGILGKKIELVTRDSKSQADLSKQNARDLIEKEKVSMVFGGSSSGVAIAVGSVCDMNNIPFFGTLTYSTSTTGEEAKKNVYRVCYDSHAAAKVLSEYMKKNFAGKKFFYITSDYNWGHTTEASFRKFTNTEDTGAHRGVKTPFPTATKEDFEKAIKIAKILKPDVLVLVLFGQDMATAIEIATREGLKSGSQIIVPNLTLGMAESGGPDNMEGVIGAIDWFHKTPDLTNNEKGKAFVKKFTEKYKRYPSCSGAYAYTILNEYKSAVEKAGSFDPAALRKALEGRKFTSLKDEETWRDFDHQCIQTVYAVKCKPAADVKKDPYSLDYFEVITTMPGDEAFRTRAEWDEVRKAAGKPLTLD